MTKKKRTVLGLTLVLAASGWLGFSPRASAEEVFSGASCAFPGSQQAMSDAQLEKNMQSGNAAGGGGLKLRTLQLCTSLDCDVDVLNPDVTD